MQALQWQKDKLILLDQTQLPKRVVYITCQDAQAVVAAIKRLQVRGAPLIGAAAAFGLVLGAKQLVRCGQELNCDKLREIADSLRGTRPTAINLFWALDRMLAVASRYDSTTTTEEMLAALEKEALAIVREDAVQNKRIGEYGAALLKPGWAVLTHCNAGTLATVAFGTALGIIRSAWQQGRLARVFADETRPLLQGARLTAWELSREGIPVTLITDNMAGWVMRQKMVQAVVVGADRIAANGDTANKIGTYSLAVLAREHNLPFFVAAPLSTFDFSLASGNDIPIEERSPEEVTSLGGMAIAPPGVAVYNPAFDVTPAELITGIITEYGVLMSPNKENIAKLRGRKEVY